MKSVYVGQVFVDQKTESTMYHAPSVRTPTLEEIEEIAKSENLGLDKEKLKEYHGK